MLIMTHFVLGCFLGKKMAGCGNKNFNLSKRAFVLGNIYPDISKMGTLCHHYERTEHLYNLYLNNSMTPSLSVTERSFSLGCACHFVCDYFTKYHAKDPYKSRNFIEHTLYELRLHRRVMAHLKNASPQGQKVSAQKQYHLDALRKAYFLEADSMDDDAAYALHALDGMLRQVLGHSRADTAGIQAKAVAEQGYVA